MIQMQSNVQKNIAAQNISRQAQEHRQQFVKKLSLLLAAPYASWIVSAVSWY